MNEMALHGIGAVQEDGGHVSLWSLLTSSKYHVHWKEGGESKWLGAQMGQKCLLGLWPSLPHLPGCPFPPQPDPVMWGLQPLTAPHPRLGPLQSQRGLSKVTAVQSLP